MVLIETEQVSENQITTEQTGMTTEQNFSVENSQITQEVQPETTQVQETQTETQETTTEAPKGFTLSFNIKGTFQRLGHKITNLFHSFRGSLDMDTVGMPANKKADFYVKKCWNHMARNEVNEAKENYDKLVDIYESLGEGDLKKQMYQEVYDIYSRLAQVPEQS